VAPRITVIGVGGAGGNAVANMIRRAVEGVEFIVANTDAQALNAIACRASHPARQHASPRALAPAPVPKSAAQRPRKRARDRSSRLEGAHMVFITAGMGGGTGTGAAPVIAKIAREQGILTVGVVTKPFHFEGTRRMRLAERASGTAEACRYADRHSQPEPVPHRQRKTTFADAFLMADEVLHSGRARHHRPDGHAGPHQPRLRRRPLRHGRDGQGDDGHRRSDRRKPRARAAEKAISNPLLDDVSMKGAKGVLINITGGLT
jgi:cell division protein FtsZ